MDNAKSTYPIRHVRRWHVDECPQGCCYLAEGLSHTHERHDDGSKAVAHWTSAGQYELLEFQGTLGF